MATRQANDKNNVDAKVADTSKLQQFFIINNSDFNVYIDLDGNEVTEDTVIIGPKGNAKVFITEARTKELNSEYPYLIFKRIGE